MVSPLSAPQFGFGNRQWDEVSSPWIFVLPEVTQLEQEQGMSLVGSTNSDVVSQPTGEMVAVRNFSAFGRGGGAAGAVRQLASVGLHIRRLQTGIARYR